MHGYTVAIWWAAGIMLLAGLVAGLMVTTGPPRRAPAESAVPESVGRRHPAPAGSPRTS